MPSILNVSENSGNCLGFEKGDSYNILIMIFEGHALVISGLKQSSECLKDATSASLAHDLCLRTCLADETKETEEDEVFTSDGILEVVLEITSSSDDFGLSEEEEFDGDELLREISYDGIAKFSAKSTQSLNCVNAEYRSMDKGYA